jgi:hypothetical protein
MKNSSKMSKFLIDLVVNFRGKGFRCRSNVFWRVTLIVKMTILCKFPCLRRTVEGRTLLSPGREWQVRTYYLVLWFSTLNQRHPTGIFSIRDWEKQEQNDIACTKRSILESLAFSNIIEFLKVCTICFSLSWWRHCTFMKVRSRSKLSYHFECANEGSPLKQRLLYVRLPLPPW